MKLATFILILTNVITLVISEDVRLDNLEPNEAQQIIESKEQTLKYAPKVDSNVPAVRFLGNEPHNVLEDIYLANQYHGQDGVGGYLYGYSVPDIAKTEKKKAGGDLRGAYNYVNGQGQEIKVEYWDDGTGFHQIDNVPKILPKQIDDLPEVQAAKEEHARLWKEQAERNSKPVAYPYINNAYKPEIAAQIGAQSHPGQSQQYQQQPQGQYQQQPQGQYQQQPQGQYQQQPQGQQKPQGQYQGQQQPQGQYQGQQQPQGQYQAQLQQSQQYQQQPQGQYHGQQQQPQGQYQGQQQPQGQFQGQQKPQGQFQGQQPQGQYQGQQKPQGQFQGQQPQGLGQSYKPGVNVGHPAGNVNQIDYSGQYSNNQDSYAKQQQDDNDDGSYDSSKDNNEENGPPHGFFYNFDYPVGIIVSKDGGNQIQKRESSLNELYLKNKELLEKQLKGEIKSQNSNTNYFVTS